MKFLVFIISLSFLLGCNNSNNKIEQDPIVTNKCHGSHMTKKFESDSASYLIEGIIISRGVLRKAKDYHSAMPENEKMYGRLIYPNPTRRINDKVKGETKILKNRIVYYFDVQNFQANELDIPQDVKYREVFLINYPILYNISQNATINYKIKNLFHDSQLKIISQSHEAKQAYLIDSGKFAVSKSILSPDLLGGVVDIKSISLYCKGELRFLCVTSKGNSNTGDGTELGLFAYPLYFDLKTSKLVKPEDMLGKSIGFKIDRIINNHFLKIPADKFGPLRKDEWELQFDEEGFLLTTTELQGKQFTGKIWAYVPFCSIYSL